MAPTWISKTIVQSGVVGHVVCGNFVSVLPGPAASQVVLLHAGCSLEMLALGASGAAVSICSQPLQAGDPVVDMRALKGVPHTSPTVTAGVVSDSGAEGSGPQPDNLLLLTSAGRLTVLRFDSACNRFILVQEVQLVSPGTQPRFLPRLIATSPSGRFGVAVAAFQDRIFYLPPAAIAAATAAPSPLPEAGSGPIAENAAPVHAKLAPASAAAATPRRSAAVLEEAPVPYPSPTDSYVPCWQLTAGPVPGAEPRDVRRATADALAASDPRVFTGSSYLPIACRPGCGAIWDLAFLEAPCLATDAASSGGGCGDGGSGGSGGSGFRLAALVHRPAAVAQPLGHASDEILLLRPIRGSAAGPVLQCDLVVRLAGGPNAGPAFAPIRWILFRRDSPSHPDGFAAAVADGGSASGRGPLPPWQLRGGAGSKSSLSLSSSSSARWALAAAAATRSLLGTPQLLRATPPDPSVADAGVMVLGTHGALFLSAELLARHVQKLTDVAAGGGGSSDHSRRGDMVAATTAAGPPPAVESVGTPSAGVPADAAPPVGSNPDGAGPGPGPGGRLPVVNRATRAVPRHFVLETVGAAEAEAAAPPILQLEDELLAASYVCEGGAAGYAGSSAAAGVRPSPEDDDGDGDEEEDGKYDYASSASGIFMDVDDGGGDDVDVDGGDSDGLSGDSDGSAVPGRAAAGGGSSGRCAATTTATAAAAAAQDRVFSRVFRQLRLQQSRQRCTPASAAGPGWAYLRFAEAHFGAPGPAADAAAARAAAAAAGGTGRFRRRSTYAAEAAGAGGGRNIGGNGAAVVAEAVAAMEVDGGNGHDDGGVGGDGGGGGDARSDGGEDGEYLRPHEDAAGALRRRGLGSAAPMRRRPRMRTPDASSNTDLDAAEGGTFRAGLLSLLLATEMHGQAVAARTKPLKQVSPVLGVERLPAPEPRRNGHILTAAEWLPPPPPTSPPSPPPQLQRLLHSVPGGASRAAAIEPAPAAVATHRLLVCSAAGPALCLTVAVPRASPPPPTAAATVTAPATAAAMEADGAQPAMTSRHGGSGDGDAARDTGGGFRAGAGAGRVGDWLGVVRLGAVACAVPGETAAAVAAARGAVGRGGGGATVRPACTVAALPPWSGGLLVWSEEGGDVLVMRHRRKQIMVAPPPMRLLQPRAGRRQLATAAVPRPATVTSPGGHRAFAVPTTVSGVPAADNATAAAAAVAPTSLGIARSSSTNLPQVSSDAAAAAGPSATAAAAAGGRGGPQGPARQRQMPPVGDPGGRGLPSTAAAGPAVGFGPRGAGGAVSRSGPRAAGTAAPTAAAPSEVLALRLLGRAPQPRPMVDFVVREVAGVAGRGRQLQIAGAVLALEEAPLAAGALPPGPPPAPRLQVLRDYMAAPVVACTPSQGPKPTGMWSVPLRAPLAHITSSTAAAAGGSAPAHAAAVTAAATPVSSSPSPPGALPAGGSLVVLSFVGGTRALAPVRDLCFAGEPGSGSCPGAGFGYGSGSGFPAAAAVAEPSLRDVTDVLQLRHWEPTVAAGLMAEGVLVQVTPSGVLLTSLDHLSNSRPAASAAGAAAAGPSGCILPLDDSDRSGGGGGCGALWDMPLARSTWPSPKSSRFEDRSSPLEPPPQPQPLLAGPQPGGGSRPQPQQLEDVSSAGRSASASASLPVGATPHADGGSGRALAAAASEGEVGGAAAAAAAPQGPRGSPTAGPPGDAEAAAGGQAGAAAGGGSRAPSASGCSSMTEGMGAIALVSDMQVDDEAANNGGVRAARSTAGTLLYPPPPPSPVLADGVAVVQGAAAAAAAAASQAPLPPPLPAVAGREPSGFSSGDGGALGSGGAAAAAEAEVWHGGAAWWSTAAPDISLGAVALGCVALVRRLDRRITVLGVVQHAGGGSGVGDGPGTPRSAAAATAASNSSGSRHGRKRPRSGVSVRDLGCSPPLDCDPSCCALRPLPPFAQPLAAAASPPVLARPQGTVAFRRSPSASSTSAVFAAGSAADAPESCPSTATAWAPLPGLPPLPPRTAAAAAAAGAQTAPPGAIAATGGSAALATAPYHAPWRYHLLVGDHAPSIQLFLLTHGSAGLHCTRLARISTVVPHGLCPSAGLAGPQAAPVPGSVVFVAPAPLPTAAVAALGPTATATGRAAGGATRGCGKALGPLPPSVEFTTGPTSAGARAAPPDGVAAAAAEAVMCLVGLRTGGVAAFGYGGAAEAAGASLSTAVAPAQGSANGADYSAVAVASNAGCDGDGDGAELMDSDAPGPVTAAPPATAPPSACDACPAGHSSGTGGGGSSPAALRLLWYSPLEQVPLHLSSLGPCRPWQALAVGSAVHLVELTGPSGRLVCSPLLPAAGDWVDCSATAAAAPPPPPQQGLEALLAVPLYLPPAVAPSQVPPSRCPAGLAESRQRPVTPAAPAGGLPLELVLVALSDGSWRLVSLQRLGRLGLQPLSLTTLDLQGAEGAGAGGPTRGSVGSGGGGGPAPSLPLPGTAPVGRPRLLLHLSMPPPAPPGRCLLPVHDDGGGIGGNGACCDGDDAADRQPPSQETTVGATAGGSGGGGQFLVLLADDPAAPPTTVLQQRPQPAGSRYIHLLEAVTGRHVSSFDIDAVAHGFQGTCAAVWPVGPGAGVAALPPPLRERPAAARGLAGEAEGAGPGLGGGGDGDGEGAVVEPPPGPAALRWQQQRWPWDGPPWAAADAAAADADPQEAAAAHRLPGVEAAGDFGRAAAAPLRRDAGLGRGNWPPPPPAEAADARMAAIRLVQRQHRQLMRRVGPGRGEDAGDGDGGNAAAPEDVRWWFEELADAMEDDEAWDEVGRGGVAGQVAARRQQPPEFWRLQVDREAEFNALIRGMQAHPAPHAAPQAHAAAQPPGAHGPEEQEPEARREERGGGDIGEGSGAEYVRRAKRRRPVAGAGATAALLAVGCSGQGGGEVILLRAVPALLLQSGDGGAAAADGSDDAGVLLEGFLPTASAAAAVADAIGGGGGSLAATHVVHLQVVHRLLLAKPVTAVCPYGGDTLVVAAGCRLLLYALCEGRLHRTGWIATRNHVMAMSACPVRQLLACTDGSTGVMLYKAEHVDDVDGSPPVALRVIAADPVSRPVTSVLLLPPSPPWPLQQQQQQQLLQRQGSAAPGRSERSAASRGGAEAMGVNAAAGAPDAAAAAGGDTPPAGVEAGAGPGAAAAAAEEAEEAVVIAAAECSGKLLLLAPGPRSSLPCRNLVVRAEAHCPDAGLRLRAHLPHPVHRYNTARPLQPHAPTLLLGGLSGAVHSVRPCPVAAAPLLALLERAAATHPAVRPPNGGRHRAVPEPEPGPEAADNAGLWWWWCHQPHPGVLDGDLLEGLMELPQHARLQLLRRVPREALWPALSAARSGQVADYHGAVAAVDARLRAQEEEEQARGVEQEAEGWSAMHVDEGVAAAGASSMGFVGAGRDREREGAPRGGAREEHRRPVQARAQLEEKLEEQQGQKLGRCGALGRCPAGSELDEEEQELDSVLCTVLQEVLLLA